MKNKTLATWLTFGLGPLGMHRFYLFARSDPIGWALPIPTALGLYGMMRARGLGLDDHISWILIPVLGFTVAACCLNAIVYGLMSEAAWNSRFNNVEPDEPQTSTHGRSNWLTIVGVVAALMIGATALMASLAYSFQRYFEWQIELARQISQ